MRYLKKLKCRQDTASPNVFSAAYGIYIAIDRLSVAVNSYLPVFFILEPLVYTLQVRLRRAKGKNSFHFMNTLLYSYGGEFLRVYSKGMGRGFEL